MHGHEYSKATVIYCREEKELDGSNMNPTKEMNLQSDLEGL